MQSVNLTQSQILLEILPKYTKAVFNAKGADELKAPSFELFRDIVAAVLADEEVEITTKKRPQEVIETLGKQSS